MKQGNREREKKMASSDYDREAELKALEELAGVKGLVDSRITKLPRIFILPPEDRVQIPENPDVQLGLSIPVIDLTGAEAGSGSWRAEVVGGVRRASKEWGFFQVVGHGIPVDLIEAALEGVRGFHEGDAGVKAEFYSREPGRWVKFFANYRSPKNVASWRDTLLCRTAPDTPNSDELPDNCRETLMAYTKHVMKLGTALFELLSEALGLESSHLTDIECNQVQLLLAHYYPVCPEPELTIGTGKHHDSNFLTVLLQDQTGGLQVLHRDHWVDVPPVPGALVVNIGDLLQLISNDRFQSVEHRVLANKTKPRVSLPYFFIGSASSTKLYGPIKELISEENPPLYRETLAGDYMNFCRSEGLHGKSALSYYELKYITADGSKIVEAPMRI